MKKRIVCVLLTLIMLLSLVPMTASAATRTTSEAAITVLKQLTPFRGTCYHIKDTADFLVGYGTVCEEEGHAYKTVDGVILEDADKSEKHIITQSKADQALRKVLLGLDEKVNSFASANGLSLSQNQHDALVVFSHEAGTGWMDGTSAVKTAILNNASTNELLTAMHNWANISDSLDRRKVEVNMYVNGIYSNTIPSNYSQVTYYANGGTMAQSNGSHPDYGKLYIKQFDSSVAIAHDVVVSRGGYSFVGWYFMEGSALRRAPDLRSYYEDGELIALWQKTSAKYTDAMALPAGYAVDYSISSSMLAEQNVYDKPEGKVLENTKVTATMKVSKDFIDDDGDLWSYVSALKGWVMVGSHSGSSAGSNVYVDVMVTVTSGNLNRRVNATIFSAKNGSYSAGDQLWIINTASADGFTWGQVAVNNNGEAEAVGWVALMYTNWSTVKDSGNGSSYNGSTIATAVVTFNGYLNVRNGAGTDNKIVGSLAKNDQVDIYEIKTVNGHQWGRCNAGWICLSYASVTMKNDKDQSEYSASDYLYTGKIQTADVYVDAGASEKAATLPKAGQDVGIVQLKSYNNITWGKATWTVTTLDKDKNEVVTRYYGWVDMDKIDMDPAEYTVVCDELNVRSYANDGADLVFSLNKGVQVEVNEINLVGENIWGHITARQVVQSGVTGWLDGWINLASKYVSRGNAPTIDTSNSATITGKVGTVINTDSLRVRSTGATYGTVIGSLSRGTTVAVWESADGWYKVDSNQNGTYEYDGDGWVSGSYLNVYEGTVGGDQTVTDNAGNTYVTSGTGTGVVSNTYTGVRIRSGAGTAHAQVGTLLNGTIVEILETTTVGATKWGRVAQGWICMDYVTMLSYNDLVDSSIPEGGITVDSYDNAQKTSTTAVYTGRVIQSVDVMKTAEPFVTPADHDDNRIRTAAAGENVTIYELAKVVKTETVKTEEGTRDSVEAGQIAGGDRDQVWETTVTTTTYWARINDGWIQDPEVVLELNALDEAVHTLTGAETLKVRTDWYADANGNPTGTIIDVLVQGDQVNVTALEISKDKVWGRIHTDEGTGWIRLDYMSEGAVYVNKAPEQVTVTNPVIGNTGNTGGYVTNNSGYRYTGKVINTNELNVRATASTAAGVTTTLKSGAALVIYETTIAENMAWGRCDAGWVYLYYVDLVPAVDGAVDSRVVYQDNTVIYTDVNCSGTNGTYARMQVIDIYEIVGKMARTDLGWVNTDNLL